MESKAIKIGERYAVVRYRPRRLSGHLDIATMRPDQFDDLAEAVYCVEVVEKDVELPWLTRRGVKVRHVPELSDGRHVGRNHSDEDGCQLLQTAWVLWPWAVWENAWADRIESQERIEREQIERRRVQEERERERRAQEWMTREFAGAQSDYDEFVELGLVDPAAQDRDETVRRIVDHRNPEGNPYLNGSES